MAYRDDYLDSLEEEDSCRDVGVVLENVGHNFFRISIVVDADIL